MRKLLRHLPVLAALLLASCANDASEPTPATTQQGFRMRSADEWVSERNKDAGYTTDKNGNLVGKSKKRSSFESAGQDPNFQGKYKTKAYKAGDYKTKSWWGSKDYGTKKYAGNTDGSRFQKNSRFAQQKSREAGNKARETGNTYGTNTYHTDSAREASYDDLDHPSSPNIDSAQSKFKAPDIFSWNSQRAMSLQESKGILGR